MTLLWVGIALLTLVAVAIVFWPLLRNRHAHLEKLQLVDRKAQNIEIFKERLSELERERDMGTLAEQEFAELKIELERNLLYDAADMQSTQSRVRLGKRQLIVVTLLALMVPVMSFSLYQHLGRADDLAVAMHRAAFDTSFAEGPTSIEEAIERLETELERNPNNPEGWYLLATTLMNLNEFDRAVGSFRQALDYLPESSQEYPGVMGQLSQAMFFARGGQVDDQVRDQIDATLALDVNEVTSLGLLGIDAFEQGRYEEAARFWEHALAYAEEGQASVSLQAGIDRARERMQQGQEPELLRITIEVAPELMTEIRSDQTVYVFARPVGGRMPAAAMRLQVRQLPATVSFNDAMAMMPEMRLSQFEEVEVVARISQQGTPEEQPGDFKGSLGNVKVSTSDGTYTLVIDQLVE
ncbi:c-type cytochrome biogenesis protein CcmI [Nitrincola alkalilacustris]|uniref:c-type cytochrome biogenesis protein CcmI n=1 Tax=Nitrincola alkalilacustris TaxID=1571224 RepID=UPI00124E60F8|nr:c-type cytochrome biogenesis protein CcmI [Nitrincola alkalilacustris]